MSHRQRASLTLLLGLIFFLAFWAVRSVEKPEGPKQCQGTYECAKSENQSKSGETNWQWLTKNAADFFTFVLACLTAVLAAVSVVQIVFLKRADETARISATAATKSALAATTAANAAVRGTEVAIQSAASTANATIETQRAYVYVGDFPQCHFIGNDGVLLGYSIAISFVNTGETPARRVKFMAAIQAQPDGTALPNDFEFKMPQKPERYTQPIGPKTSFVTEYIHIMNKDMQSIVDGKRRVYLWGWIEYNDIFTGTPRRRTEFCAEINASGNPASGKCTILFNAYHRHSGADEDCMNPVQTT